MIVKVARNLCITTIALIAAGFVYGTEELAVEQILAMPDGPAEGVEENCLYARNIKHWEILSDEMVLIHSKFNRYWLNRLSGRCVGLRKNMLVIVDRYGSQLCANDRFAAQRSGGSISTRRTGMVARCRLGQFEEVVVEQISTLKQSLDES